jgi:quercetin dioxygenase-like cupin family protein
MRLGNIELVAGDTFIIEPNEVADPTFHEDCTIVTVKTPSVIGDKYVL